MPLPWFHVEEVPEPGESAQLDEKEARHALGSRRLADDDRLVLFDGRGTIAEAALTIQGERRRSVVARVIERSVEPPAQPAIHLAAALPKGDRQAVLLGMATQLGLASFAPLMCTHGIVLPGESFGERARRVCLESCKQCRCAYLPAIEPAMTPRECAERAQARGGMFWLAHPGGLALREVAGSLDPGQARQLEHCVMIGPEGGFTEEEARMVESHGAMVCDLGPTLLRTETAAVAMLAWLRLAFA